MNDPNEFVNWTENNFKYVHYNPRKPIERYGLSITSLDGGTSGIPDLDSLLQYNKENGTKYDESDFNIPTPVYNYPQLSKCLDPIKDYICRTHVIKMKPGGYFPPHRDIMFNYFSSFRLIIPLRNMNPPNFNFMLDNRLLQWNHGRMYFINTAKTHYLFNSGFEDSYMIIINVVLSEFSVDYVAYNLKFM